MTQNKQVQWAQQWDQFTDNELFLFRDWIMPNKLEDFDGKSTLECGCGGGQHTEFISPHCERVVAVDLNSMETARQRNRNATNIEFLEADVAQMELNEKFDIVFSIGVIHHTDNPDKTVGNMKAHLKPGGRLIIWVYSVEGNWIAKNIVERLRKLFLNNSRTEYIQRLSRVLTAIMYIPIYTVYLLPLPFLPYHSYFKNFRVLSFKRNLLNVFDKLNAPQVEFIDKQRVEKWFSEAEFDAVSIDQYRGVSWRASGTLKPE